MRHATKFVIACVLGVAVAARNPVLDKQDYARKAQAHIIDQPAMEDFADHGDSPGARFEGPFKKAAAVAAAAGIFGPRENYPDNRIMPRAGGDGATFDGDLRYPKQRDDARRQGPHHFDDDRDPLLQGDMRGARLEPGGADEPDVAALPPAGEMQNEGGMVIEDPRHQPTMKLIPVDLDVNDANDDDEGESPVTAKVFFSHRTLVTENIGKLSAATVGLAAMGAVTYGCIYAGRRRRRRNSGNTPLPMTNPWPLQPGGGRRH